MNQLAARTFYMLFGALPGFLLLFVAAGIALIGPFTADWPFIVYSAAALFGYFCGLVAILFMRSLSSASRYLVMGGIIIGLCAYAPLLMLIGLFDLALLVSFGGPFLVGCLLVRDLARADWDELHVR